MIFRLIRTCILMAVVFGSWNTGSARPADNVVAQTGLKLELIASKESYAIGEPIEVTMRYSCTSATPLLTIWKVTYDRGGRIMDFGFQARSAEGKEVRDPLKYMLMSMGGLRGSEPLVPGKSYEQKILINDWLTFDEPGRYEVTSESSVVYQTQPGNTIGPSVTIRSAPITIAITGPNREQQDRVLTQAAEARLGTDEQRAEAMRSLRFLLNERTIPQLIAGLDDEATSFHAYCGLASLRNSALVKEALLAKLNSSPSPAPANGSAYINLLTRLDEAEAGLDPTSQDPAAEEQRTAIRAKWQALISRKALDATRGLPPAQAAVALIDAVSVGGTTGATPAQLRIVLQNLSSLQDIEASRAEYVIYGSCRKKEFLPDLRLVAVDEKVSPALRSSALTALHVLGDDRDRDLIVEDLCAKSPVLKPSAWATLGDYRARDIAKALLRNALDNSFEVRLRAAQTLRDFGTGVTEVDLTTLIDEQIQQGRFNSPELVEALASRSPKTALLLIRRLREGNIKSENDFRPIALQLMARLLAAQSSVQEELHIDDPQRRLKMLAALRQAAYSQTRITYEDFPPHADFSNVIPGDKKLLIALFPDLLKLAASDSKDEARSTAATIMAIVSKTPAEFRGAIPLADVPDFLPLWKEWAAAQPR